MENSVYSLVTCGENDMALGAYCPDHNDPSVPWHVTTERTITVDGAAQSRVWHHVSEDNGATWTSFQLDDFREWYPQSLIVPHNSWFIDCQNLNGTDDAVVTYTKGSVNHPNIHGYATVQRITKVDGVWTKKLLYHFDGWEQGAPDHIVATSALISHSNGYVYSTYVVRNGLINGVYDVDWRARVVKIDPDGDFDLATMTGSAVIDEAIVGTKQAVDGSSCRVYSMLEGMSGEVVIVNSYNRYYTLSDGVQAVDYASELIPLDPDDLSYVITTGTHSVRLASTMMTSTGEFERGRCGACLDTTRGLLHVMTYAPYDDNTPTLKYTPLHGVVDAATWTEIDWYEGYDHKFGLGYADGYGSGGYRPCYLPDIDAVIGAIRPWDSSGNVIVADQRNVLLHLDTHTVDVLPYVYYSFPRECSGELVFYADKTWFSGSTPYAVNAYFPTWPDVGCTASTGTVLGRIPLSVVIAMSDSSDIDLAYPGTPPFKIERRVV